MKNVIERLLNLLAFLLTAGRPVTADEIRQTVAGYDLDNDSAFHRMFERDKDLLRQMGIPLRTAFTDAWEVEHGYVVSPDDYQLRDPGLSDEERASLWLAAQVVRLGGQPAGPEALLKLGGAPMAMAGEPLAADLGTAADDLVTVFTAVAERRLLGFVYRDKPRRLRPYGMIHQRGHWYVVGGLDDEPSETRAFRIDRGERWDVGEDLNVFERPAGFDARSALPSVPWEAGDEDVEAIVRFDPDVAWWARRQLSSSARVTTEGDGGLAVTMTVANPDAFVGWILGFEAQAEIIGPPELRTRLIERVKAVA